MAQQQLPLPLEHRPALEQEDFLVAPSNAEAVAWLDRWPDWPAPALILLGESGSGKSHLAQVFAARSGAPVIAGELGLRLDPPALLAANDAVVIDDVDAGVHETDLFHLYNLAKETGATLLLTCTTPPSLWVTLPDLRSRLSAAPAVSIGPPDDTVMAAVLIKLFSDRQLKIGVEVISYLLRHMERSHAAARLVVDAADHLSLVRQRPVTVPLVREILESVRPKGAGALSDEDEDDE